MCTISYLTRIEVGEGQVARLPEFLAALAIKRPLIVTDKGLVATGLVDKVCALLPSAPAIFDGTPANPTEDAVHEAYSSYKAEGCDGIVGLGGGSALDLAKGVRLLTGHEGPLALYTLVAGGLPRIHGRICPMIAIPTTSGTGSEVGRAAVIITAEGRKLGIISPHMLPSIALCDPELTYGLPPFLTAATGMDAISHCLETYMAPAFNPPADASAMACLTRCARPLAASRPSVADSLPWFRQVLNEVAREFGFRPLPPDEIEQLRRSSSRDILKRLDVPLWKVPRIATHMRAMKRHALRDIPLFAGVPDMLRTLAQDGIRLALVSSDNEANTRLQLGDSARLISD